VGRNLGWLQPPHGGRPPHFWSRGSHPTAGLGVVEPPPWPRGWSGHPQKKKKKKKKNEKWVLAFWGGRTTSKDLVLLQKSIKKGDVVMVLLQNCAEFVFSFLGASMLGAVTTTANPFYTSAEVFKQLNSSRAKLIITQSQ
jgi:long-subunit acyl-CoA synthetase (AMP-forming)